MSETGGRRKSDKTSVFNEETPTTRSGRGFLLLKINELMESEFVDLPHGTGGEKGVPLTRRPGEKLALAAPGTVEWLTNAVEPFPSVMRLKLIPPRGVV